MLRWLPENVSTFGGEIDHILAVIYYVVGAWLVLAEVVLFWFLLRYRRRRGVRAGYAPGNTLRAASWVLVPAALILVCDLAIDFAGAGAWKTVKETLPPAGEVARAKGEQFAWRFTHAGSDGELDTEDDIPSLGHLYVPVGTVVHLDLESKDVLHSLWLPHLRLKQDAVPGRTIKVWFEVTEVGEYPIACAELCGFGHTKMAGVLHALAPEDYREWVASQESYDMFWDDEE